MAWAARTWGEDRVGFAALHLREETRKVQRINGRSRTDDFVVPLRAPRWARWTFPAISAVLMVAAVALITLDRSWQGIFWGLLLLGSLVAIWITILAARRTRRGAPMEITATRDGLRSPLWALDWERVERMWIGDTQAGLRALSIEPLQEADIRRSPSTALSLSAIAGNAMNIPAIQILEANVELPLEEIAARFEEKAGRQLLVRPELDASRV